MSAKQGGADRMSARMLQLARRQGRLPALVAALGIAVYLVVKSIISILVDWAINGAYAAVTPTENRLDFGPFFGGLPQQLLLTVLPFCLGIFLGLWLIAPLAEQLTLAFVLTRGALAAAAGSILVLVVNFFAALVGALARLTDSGNLRFENQIFDVAGFLQGTLAAIGTSAGMFIAEVVAVLFASVLLWLWLREHPRDYEVSGLIDEV